MATRPCQAEDVVLLEELVEEALVEVARWRGGAMLRELCPLGDLSEQLSRCLNSPLHSCRLGTIDQVVVAAAIGSYMTLASSGKLAQVKMLYVLPDARGVGVGELLIGDLLSWAKQHGCVGLDAAALPGDRLTKNFYESQKMVARSLTLYCDLD